LELNLITKPDYFLRRFNAGFFSPGKADLAVVPGAYISVCDQAGDKSNAVWWKKDKLKGL
jgi:hypothetical protein